MIKGSIREISGPIVKLRRQLHSIPEIAFKEKKTSSLISKHLLESGVEVIGGIGKTGVVGIIEGSNSGKTLMIRADIDALPLEEKTELSFSSTNGNMHACGHDGHTAIALMTARAISKLKDTFNGKVVFVFQPAEEIVAGAKEMINEGLLETYQPDRVIGLHIWNEIPVGTIAVNDGSVFASADGFRIKFIGKGGHGALPDRTIDPIVMAAEFISVVQSIVSREISPNEMGVLTVGQIHGGTAPNIIPDMVLLEGTIRAYSTKVRKQIISSVGRIATGISQTMKGDSRFEILYGTPPVVNDSKVAKWMSGIATSVVGKKKVTEWDPVSVGDDVSEFINRIPGAYILLGGGFTEDSLLDDSSSGHHNNRFDFDEKCLPIGVELFLRATFDFLS
ncbi:M20 family metallopeptidase [Dehalococcoidia bacterium]|nr:M20 family metallopeptidase [Dehalococcoidia bacterium]